jgi:hypothetical protein
VNNFKQHLARVLLEMSRFDPVAHASNIDDREADAVASYNRGRKGSRRGSGKGSRTRSTQPVEPVRITPVKVAPAVTPPKKPTQKDLPF